MRLLFLATAIGVLPPQPPEPAALGAPPATPSLWWMENDGRPVGVPDADVDAATAWAVTLGDPAVLVAIVDTGVEIAHPELAASIHVNAGEIPGNALDDDGNGLADDVSGWDFADDDADTTDPFGITHGTPVAGLVAGSVTGLAPGVTILPVKVFSDSGVDPAFEQAAADGILYAIEQGADVIVFAWITGEPGATLEAALDAAVAAGVVMVAPAGNDGEQGVFPAAHTGVIGVAGTNRHDRFVDVPGLFVSGAGVEIAAPTEKLETTTLTTSGSRVLFTGTSASAPLVGAAAALALSANPALTALQVRDVLLAGADPLPDLAGRVDSGRLNAGNAVLLASGAGAAPPRVTLSPVEKTEPLASTLYDARGASGASAIEWTFVDRGDDLDALSLEHRFTDGGVWPVTVAVTGADGLTHTAHTETLVPFQGVATGFTAATAHPYAPGLQLVTITAPGANAMRLRFSRIELAAGDSLILYDEAQAAVRALPASAVDHEETLRGSAAYLYLLGYTGGAFGFSLDAVEAAFDGDVNRAPSIVVSGASGAALGTVVPFAANALDPDGDDVTVTWRLLKRPDDSTAELSALSGATTSLGVDAHGDYAIAAIATDGLRESSTLTWIVTRDRESGGGVGCSMTPARRSPLPLLLCALLLLFRRRR